MRKDVDEIMQRLIKNMVEKESDEGEITLKLTVKFVTEYVDDGVSRAARRALKPSYQHKVTSQMKMQDNKGGTSYNGLKEVVLDEESGLYVTRYIQGAQQMNMFEGDFGKQILPELPEAKDAERHESDDIATDMVIDADFKEADMAPDAPEGSDSHYGNVDEKNIEEVKENATEAEIQVEFSSDDLNIDDEYAAEYAEFDGYAYDDPESEEVTWRN